MGQDVYLAKEICRLKKKIDCYFEHTGTKIFSGLTRNQCDVIRYIMIRPDQDVFQKDIENAFSISGATASNMLKSMEAKGFIERVPTEKDARLKKICVTQKAKELGQLGWENVLHLEKTIMEGLSEEEIAIFRSVMDKMTQNIEELNQKSVK